MPVLRRHYFAPYTPSHPESSSLPLIPRETLFGNPDRVNPELSPDARLLAYLAPHDGVLNIWVRTVGTTDDRPITADRIRPVRAYVWAQNSRHILYMQDKGGDENFRVYRVDVESGEETDLTPYEGVRAAVFGISPRHPDSILIQLNRRNPQLMDAERLDLITGEMTVVAENPGGVVGWVPDHDLQIRAALAFRPDGGQELRVRDTENDPWRTALTAAFGDRIVPVAFSGDGRSLYIESSINVNTLGLYRLDMATGDQEFVCGRDDVDLGGILIHPTDYHLQAVSYNRSRTEWVALDPDVAADLEVLKNLAEGDFGILTRNNADTTWLIGYTRDNGSPAYYTYDRATKTATLLFTARPDLDQYVLARTEPIDVTAGDGLVIPCYLTVPPQTEPKGLPLVLLPHGGPWARDYWGYSSFVQWLANRGYAVLLVNFRGSTGFGKNFHNAGNREWAKKMQTDLYDAVDDVVGKGIVDPERVAIFGGSYGGYAVLVAMTMAPERFVCGVDLFGPSNITTLFASIPPYWAPLKSEFMLRVGDPDAEPDFIRSISPLFFADRIVRPMLIAQGANDPRVRQPESDQIVAAMRAAGKDVTYLVYPDEGHGFARPENNITFVAAAEAFLAKYLGGRAEPPHAGEEPPLVTE